MREGGESQEEHLFSLDVHFYSLGIDSNCLVNSVEGGGGGDFPKEK